MKFPAGNVLQHAWTEPLLEEMFLAGDLPTQWRKIRFARNFLVRMLRRQGFDAFVPKEEKRGPHFDIHIRVASIPEARKTAKRLQAMYDLRIKKRHANGTHLLTFPHLLAIMVSK